MAKRTLASAASRGALRVFSATFDNLKVIAACRGKAEFTALTRISSAMIDGPSSNPQEIATAMSNIGTPFARPVRSLNEVFTPWTPPKPNPHAKRMRR